MPKVAIVTATATEDSMNSRFSAEVCVLKPGGQKQVKAALDDPLRKPSTNGPEFFERVTAGWKEICATTIANLTVQQYLRDAQQDEEEEEQRRQSGKPIQGGGRRVDNVWSIHADVMDWERHRYFFNKKDHILPYVDRHWKALCTDRSRTQTWWATLGSCLYISKDVFLALDENARSASSDFCLAKSNLWNIKPGHITSHQSSGLKAQTARAPREGKRKANAAGMEESGSKKSSKSEKASKSKSASASAHLDKNSVTSGSSANATPTNNGTNSNVASSTATPTPTPVTKRSGSSRPTAVVPQPYIPLPNVVIPGTGPNNTYTPYNASNEHPYNKHRFRYVMCEPDPLLQYMLYRQYTNPPFAGVRLSREDMSPYMTIDEEYKTISTEKGFRMARANCGVREGKWYFEVKIDRGGEPKHEGRDGAHVRLGWARREATLQAPVGFDAYSYGVRDTTGQKVHQSRVFPFAEPFKSGDVIGMYISLPPDGNECSFFKHRRLRRPFMFKGQLYFESIDYSPTKRFIEMAEYEATPVKTNLEKPIPPPVIPNSKIIMYKNGVCQGVLWQDLFALLPIEKNEKEKDQTLIDDGTLGYYPAISVYNQGNDPEAEAEAGALNQKPTPLKDEEKKPSKKHQENNSKTVVLANTAAISSKEKTWRPMSERWDELLVEECLIDLVDEVELWVGQMELKERDRVAAQNGVVGGSIATAAATIAAPIGSNSPSRSREKASPAPSTQSVSRGGSAGSSSSHSLRRGYSYEDGDEGMTTGDESGAERQHSATPVPSSLRNEYRRSQLHREQQRRLTESPSQPSRSPSRSRSHSRSRSRSPSRTRSPRDGGGESLEMEVDSGLERDDTNDRMDYDREPADEDEDDEEDFDDDGAEGDRHGRRASSSSGSQNPQHHHHHNHHHYLYQQQERQQSQQQKQRRQQRQTTEEFEAEDYRQQREEQEERQRMLDEEEIEYAGGSEQEDSYRPEDERFQSNSPS
ncbi:hypothetical protein DFQ27_005436 [Actinomortierella ambigua]|uniref:B30.2/SPRY domain-containing protein n=1 Tax=Actinomortierella ambigua TaxID=1343610 RepID=A0A9P6Q1F1_9FUNG|nr:hypothetical protein DFQ27_005436 [Actinomortierella ambigua]